MNKLPNPITDALDDYAIAAAKCADLREAEQQIEDERPLAKHEAIGRIMQFTNPLTQKPHSSSSAEAIVESDPDYMAYLVKRRNATHAHMLAQSEREEARLKAVAFANISAQLVEAA